MMKTQTLREALHDILVAVLGSSHVYYDPPENLKMKYPAIVHNRNNIQNTFSDHIPYKQTRPYSVTAIDEDPDSEIVDKLSLIPMCNYEQHFTSNGMNHDVFIINF